MKTKETKINKLTDSMIKNHADYANMFRRYLSQNTKHLLLTVTNDTNQEIKRTLFGASDYDESSLKNIKSVHYNISYRLILNNLLSKTLYVEKVRVCSTNEKAVANVIALVSKNMFGEEVQIPLITQSYVSVFQIQKNIIDVSYPIIIDLNTSLIVTIPANTTVSYTFFTSKLIEFTSKFLKHNNRGVFIGTCLDLINKSDSILKSYYENPYLHSSEVIIPYFNAIHKKINQWINDKNFGFSFHKNLIDIYDTLTPFVGKYKQLVNDAEPLLYEYRKSNYDAYCAEEEKSKKKTTLIDLINKKLKGKQVVKKSAKKITKKTTKK